MIRAMELKDIKAEVKAVKPEEMSLKDLLEESRRAQDTFTRLTRSAYEIGEYNLRGSVANFTEVCDEASELKRKLVGILLEQSSYYLSLMMETDAEIDKRLEKQ